jgi:AcrR family transcriptional regulator
MGNGQREGSLRERSKARRRAAIERSALRLFTERGYDATTIADIAADAEVAPRTVWAYFPTKANLVTSRIDAAIRRLRDAVTARPAGMPVLDAVDEWLSHDEALNDGETLPMYANLFTAQPDLRSFRGEESIHGETAIARAFADELGLGPDDFVPRAVQGAVFGVISEYVHGAKTADIADLQHARDDAFTFLKAGLSAVAADADRTRAPAAEVPFAGLRDDR